ncbi:MAG: hypothetical protein ACYDCK_01255 [Thermoplasmatota archaeon]
MGSSEINIQEQEPIVGYVTFFDSTCQNFLTDVFAPNCVGGPLRDAHSGENHAVNAHGSWTCFVPDLILVDYCSGSTGVYYSS